MMSGLGDLPTPGTPPFFPALLASIRAAAPGLPLDPVVLQALLLCLLAGDKNLILRTREEDVSSVSKLAASTLTSIFGYLTHKLRIRADSKQQTPLEFLRSLFLHSATPAPSSLSVNDDLGNASTTSARHKTVQKRRPRSRPSPPAGTISTTQRQLIPRSHSYPAESLTSPLNATGFPSNLKSSPFASRMQYPDMDTSKTDLQRPVLRPPGIHTDPTPSLQRHLSYDGLTLPSALVVTGLEDAGMPVQRSLLKVLSEKRVILEDDEGEWVWNLPDDFIVVYICVADTRERPAIHKSLLDRFAMSTTITLHFSTQQAIRYTLSHHRSHPTSPSIVSPSAPIFPDNLLKSLRSLASPPPLFSSESKINIHPTLFVYISDLFSAARHHPQLDGTLLTTRALKDVEALVRAGRIIGGDLTGVEFIRAMSKGAEANSEENDDIDRSVEDGDVESLEIGPDREKSKDSRHENANLKEAYSMPDEALDVSEADIARIVPRVLSHRLRVRDSPEDEILGSLMHTAVGSCTACEVGDQDDDVKKQSTWERRMVKDILVKILAEV